MVGVLSVSPHSGQRGKYNAMLESHISDLEGREERGGGGRHCSAMSCEKWDVGRGREGSSSILSSSRKIGLSFCEGTAIDLSSSFLQTQPRAGFFKARPFPRSDFGAEKNSLRGCSPASGEQGVAPEV